VDCFELYNGLSIPSIGYGPGIIYGAKENIRNLLLGNPKIGNDLASIQTLNKVNRFGVKLLDTSESYVKSEYYIGKMLSNNVRNDFFIVTKVSNHSQMNYSVEESFYRSLDNLKTQYIDLYLLHWPVKGYFLESWKMLEKLYERGVCKAIGVANFNLHHLKELEDNCSIMPMVNQIEYHPLFTNDEKLVEYCDEKKIQIMAYTPTARMDARMKITCLPQLATQYNKSIAQIILKWHIQENRIPIVNTSNIRHLKDNFNIFDFELTETELDLIDKININSRLRYDPDNCDFSKL